MSTGQTGSTYMLQTDVSCSFEIKSHLDNFSVLLQFLEILQSMAIAACSCRAKSYCLSGGVLSDDSNGLLHSVCLCIHLQPL